ncbi:MAG: peptidoglycan-binding protein [Chthoniobacterales bacterium]
MKLTGFIALTLTFVLAQFAQAADRNENKGKQTAHHRPPPRAAAAKARPPQSQAAFRSQQQFRRNHPGLNEDAIRQPLRDHPLRPRIHGKKDAADPSTQEIEPAIAESGPKLRNRNRGRAHGVGSGLHHADNEQTRPKEHGHPQGEGRDHIAEGRPRQDREHWRHWHRNHQDRGWWHLHYTRFCLFGGGYYYFFGGYWYPAYGYDLAYNTYIYDAPIYAYNDLTPGQVILDVQGELRQRGYYRGSLDGQYGPLTRSALLGFQRDNGLAVTGEIDEATLFALGLR